MVAIVTRLKIELFAWRLCGNQSFSALNLQRASEVVTLSKTLLCLRTCCTDRENGLACVEGKRTRVVLPFAKLDGYQNIESYLRSLSQ